MVVEKRQPTVMEMAQKIWLSHAITKVLGGLFPDKIDTSSLHNILEIGCDVGAWSLDVASTYPDKQVIGLDTKPLPLAYAEAQRVAQSLENVQFRLTETLTHLDFDDNSMDFISGRFLSPHISKGSWPVILQECRRILRPGGVISLAECILESTNNNALRTYYTYRIEVERLTGCSCPAVETDKSILQRLPELLWKAGYQGVQYIVRPVNASFSEPEQWAMFRQNFVVQFKVLQPQISAAGIATLEELEQLYVQILEEMQTEAFSALLQGLLFWGKNSR